MSNIKLLDFETGPDFGNLGFPDLERKLKERLENIKTLPDLEKVIEILNPLLKAGRFSNEEYGILRRMRQRAYDRKRHSRFEDCKSKSTPDLGIQLSKTSKSISDLERRISKSPISKLSDQGVSMAVINEKITLKADNSFTQGALRALSSINGEQFVKTAPKALGWFSAAALVSFFLWHQSLALYESAGFANSFFAATGGIFMIIGFAAYHAITRSWLALFFCVYAGAYEGYLMVTGTIKDDNHAQSITAQNNPELIFLQDRADKERGRYHELKQRYDNPESKVFKNDWFLKTNLNPSWEASAQAQQELVIKKAAMLASSSAEQVTWLKIFYRLGLVFLCLVLVHRFFADCIAKN